MDGKQSGDNPRFRPAAPKNQPPDSLNGINPATENYDADKASKYDRTSLLGPLHWISIIIYFVVIYFVSIQLDRRLPEPLSSKDAGPLKFSEERARKHLDSLASFGPRPSGSDALEISARDYLLSEIENIRGHLDTKRYRMDIDIHKPEGCYELIFLSNFTLCYKNLTSIVVRLGRSDQRDRPSSHSLLLNCHFDSVYQSPGASDDAISCAIMLELINVFANQDPEWLPYDLIFLFNGAEENFLQAAHGFITSHPWRHSIRAFINLEGCGAGGREMLFQSGPANVWLLHAYLNSAPHPHCSIMAQEIFQSGLVPADTDFRIFRDFGRMPGMDIAYIKNGYLYHTEFDRPEFVPPGSLQRGGENILATAAAIIQSPCFTKPCSQQETKLVYFDIIGLFVVQYPASFGTLLNYAVVAAIFIRILRQIQNSSNSSRGDDGYSSLEFMGAVGIHFSTMALMVATAYAMIRLTIVLDLTMAWYSWRPMVLVLYGIPTLMMGLIYHALWKRYLSNGQIGGQSAMFRQERVTYDVALLLFAVLLFGLTLKGLGSAYYALLHCLFPLMREILISAYEKIFGRQRKTALVLLIAHGIALFPVVAQASYGVISVLEFFIPVMGRSGPVLNPEVVIAAVATTTSCIMVLYLAGMVYISRSFGEVLKFATCVTLLVLAAATLTDFGAPFAYSETAPRLRRIHIQHVSRTIYGPDGSVASSENGLHMANLDYRGIRDLPPTTFLQGSTSPPCILEDAYCGLPYYVPVKDMFPPAKTLWMNVPSSPIFETPISMKLTSTKQLPNDMVKMDFSVKGSDHITLFITPLNNWTLESWSLTETSPNKLQTYFLYFASVGRGLGPWEFSLNLRKANPGHKSEPKILLGVASHYLHGKNQFTPQTKALIDGIVQRRNKPPTTMGYWKWFMTPDAMTSEYVAKYF